MRDRTYSELAGDAARWREDAERRNGLAALAPLTAAFYVTAGEMRAIWDKCGIYQGAACSETAPQFFGMPLVMVRD